MKTELSYTVLVAVDSKLPVLDRYSYINSISKVLFSQLLNFLSRY